VSKVTYIVSAEDEGVEKEAGEGSHSLEEGQGTKRSKGVLKRWGSRGPGVKSLLHHVIDREVVECHGDVLYSPRKLPLSELAIAREA